MSVLEKLEAAIPRVRSVKVCLDAAAEAEWNRLNEQLPQAARADDLEASLLEPGASLADPMPKSREVIEGMEAARERMLTSEVEFEFSIVPWPERLEMQAMHRPRDGHLVDALRGWNIETFTPALIKRACTKITDADGDELTEIPEGVWDNLLGAPAIPGTDDAPGRDAIPPALNYKQVTRMFGVALNLTDGDIEVPPSARSLLVSQDSGASLAQPSPGTRPRSDSVGGNRRTSRKSSATKKAGSSGS